MSDDDDDGDDGGGGGDGGDDGYGEMAMTVMQIRMREIKTRTVHNRACMT